MNKKLVGFILVLISLMLFVLAMIFTFISIPNNNKEEINIILVMLTSLSGTFGGYLIGKQPK